MEAGEADLATVRTRNEKGYVEGNFARLAWQRQQSSTHDPRRGSSTATSSRRTSCSCVPASSSPSSMTWVVFFDFGPFDRRAVAAWQSRVVAWRGVAVPPARFRRDPSGRDPHSAASTQVQGSPNLSIWDCAGDQERHDEHYRDTQIGTLNYMSPEAFGIVARGRRSPPVKGTTAVGQRPTSGPSVVSCTRWCMAKRRLATCALYV